MFVRLSPEPMNFIAVISPIVLKLPFVPNSDTISGVVPERPLKQKSIESSVSLYKIYYFVNPL